MFRPNSPLDLKLAVPASASPVPHWLALLLGPEDKRRRHAAMTALATAMMACCVTVMQVLVNAAGLDLRVVNWWSAFAMAGPLVALVLVRSGFSTRLADPAMTSFQMKWALTCNAAGYVIAGPVRALALPALGIIMMFGIFGRSRRDTVLVTVYAMVLYTLAVFCAAYLDSPQPTAEVIAAHLAIVLSSIVVGNLMCLQVQSMRERLRRQKLELELALVQIREMAMRDELTGLINRRQMTELMGLELRRCLRSGRSLLLAQLDIDHFKAINDQHGHAAGDQALQLFANVAVSELRSEDVLCRWGGEEFVLLLCDTALADAATLLDRVRKRLEHTPIPLRQGEVRITVSIGWTAHQVGETLETTLARADSALYEAKRQGRNCVVLKTARAAPSASASAPLPSDGLPEPAPEL